jgi:hypothetical protein
MGLRPFNARLIWDGGADRFADKRAVASRDANFRHAPCDVVELSGSKRADLVRAAISAVCTGSLKEAQLVSHLLVSFGLRLPGILRTVTVRARAFVTLSRRRICWCGVCHNGHYGFSRLRGEFEMRIRRPTLTDFVPS